MSPLPHPHPDDVIIRRDKPETFALSVNAGSPQIVCESLEEALQRADSFATSLHARVWYTAGGRTCMLVNTKLLCRIWHEYVEMPGLRLTLDQARRLWAADAHVCASALERLVDLRCLVRTPDGRYARLAEGVGDVPRLRMAKAGVPPRDAGSARRHAR